MGIHTLSLISRPSKTIAAPGSRLRHVVAVGAAKATSGEMLQLISLLEALYTPDGEDVLR